MKFPAVIDNLKTLKNGMKITLQVDDEHTKEVLRQIYNFHDKDLLVELQIDEVKEQEKLNQITNEQRKKIYALFRDIAKSTGNNKDYIKTEMKNKFMMDTNYNKEELSLSNCSKKEAANFIEYIINFSFEYGIAIQDNPKDYFDDIERAMHVFLKQKVCAVCGADAEIHHVDTIGMGADRNKTDDSNKRKIALCREHHTEAHNTGWESFAEKYHVKGVK